VSKLAYKNQMKRTSVSGEVEGEKLKPQPINHGGHKWVAPAVFLAKSFLFFNVQILRGTPAN
jgi:hypothetical protein